MFTIKKIPLKLCLVLGILFNCSFAQNTTKSQEQGFELEITQGKVTKHTTIKFNKKATDGMDRGYDLQANSEDIEDIGIYSLLADHSLLLPLAVQTVCNSNLEKTNIPIGINTFAGFYTLKISNTNLPSNILVYLQDEKTQTKYLLNQGAIKLNAIEATNANTSRFVILFEKSTLNNPINTLEGIKICYQKNKLIFNTQLKQTTSLKIFTVNGHQVYQSQLKSNENSCSIPHLSSGIYIVCLSNNTHYKTEKLLIK